MNWMGGRELLALWRPASEAGAGAARHWPVLDETAWLEERRCCSGLGRMGRARWW